MPSGTEDPGRIKDVLFGGNSGSQKRVLLAI